MKKNWTIAVSAALLFATIASITQAQIIDSHAHLLPPGMERALNPDVDASAEELRRQMKEAGVTKAAIYAMVQKSDPDAMQSYNDFILNIAKESDDFFAVVSVHPLDGEVAIEEVKRAAALGAKALKLHPFYQGFEIDNPNVSAVVKAAGEVGLAVIFDSIAASDGGATGKFVDLAIANPDTKIVLAHMAGYRFSEMILFAVFAKGPFYNGNVYFDLSAVAPLYANSPRAEELVWTIRQIGVDQFLHASDFPIFDLKSSREAIESYNFTPDELKKLLYDNAATVFGL